MTHAHFCPSCRGYFNVEHEEGRCPGQSHPCPACISAAAEAVEVFGEDELEEHARRLRRERRTDL